MAMRPIRDLFCRRPERVWILAGKGPSLDRRDQVAEQLRLYPILGLNHVCTVLPVELAHFTDLDAYLQCAEHLASAKGTSVVMPWFPHVDNRPGPMSLDQLLERHLQLAELVGEGRLYTYNSSLDRRRKAGFPTHRVKFFSAVVGLDILAANGVKTVLTIGIDGGSQYASLFDRSTLLANGRSSFDVQFGEMRRIAERYGITVRPLLEKSDAHSDLYRN